ncbi:MAG TPA: DUF6768 family protein [Gammaproteobacteria bacterium]|nr:DUF6768 family protein [Gammaproteobacteria bacterium]
MNDIDDEIRRTLSSEDAKLLARFDDDQALHRQVLDMFRGNHRWLTALGWVAGFALFAAGAYCSWRFALAEELRHMLLWMGPAGLCFLGLALVKLWFWLELQKGSVLRELKRLELQVASLAARGARADDGRHR